MTSYLPLSAMSPAAAFLAEAQGLSWALRKFVVAIHPTSAEELVTIPPWQAKYKNL